MEGADVGRDLLLAVGPCSVRRLCRRSQSDDARLVASWMLEMTDFGDDLCECSSRQNPRDCPVEPPLHNLERRLLLGEEEDALARREGVSNDVGNRLRLARAGRPLNDKVLAFHDVHEGAVLRSVGVLYQVGRDPSTTSGLSIS